MNNKLHGIVRRNGKHTLQLVILSHPLWVNEYWDDPQEAAFACQLVKYYFWQKFNLHKKWTMNEEQFLCVAHSRKVPLSDLPKVEKLLPPGVVEFVAKHRSALEHHLASNPFPERPVWEAFRYVTKEQGRTPELEQWVKECSNLAEDLRVCGEVNLSYVHTLAEAAADRIEDALAPINRAIKLLKYHCDNDMLRQRHDNYMLMRQGIQNTLDILRATEKALNDEAVGLRPKLDKLAENRPQLYCGPTQA